MNLQDFRDYCLKKNGVAEYFPFDEETLVFKVGSKMFALTNINNSVFEVNLKCEPIMSEDLRREYSAIKPGYHMNKKHWNTITIDNSIPEDKVRFLIDLSYDLVFRGLKKSEREGIYRR